MPDTAFSLRSIAFAAYAPAALSGVANGAIAPVIVLTALDRGASTSVAALVAGLSGIGGIVTNIPAGVLATRVGERRAMLAASALTACGLLLCLADLGDGAASLAVFGLGMLLVGGAGSIFQLARQAYLAEIVPLAMRARALSTLGGTMRIGGFVGPFLGAAAVHLWGLSAAYAVGLVAIALVALLVARIPDLEPAARSGPSGAPVTTRGMLRAHRRTFATVGVGVLLLSAIRQSRQVVLPLWAAHIGLSASTSSIVFGVAGAVDAATFYPAGALMDRRGRRSVAVWCTAGLGLSFMVMTTTGGLGTLAIVAVLMGLANGLGSGIVMTLGADMSPAVGRRTFLAIWRELNDVGGGGGPLLLSAVTTAAGLASGILASGAVGLVAAVVLWRFVPRRPPAPQVVTLGADVVA